VAALAIWQRRKAYSSLVWPVLEYLALFLIVLLHEYGHALACRQVGGKAKKIVLWPFGGAAYIAPPMRPGATLWSMAAGPLVNVALLAAFSLAALLSQFLGWANTMPNASTFVRTVWIINMGLLTFNLLPIYPLDGGQILRSLLWFVLGRARSLMAAVVIGFAGVAVLVGLDVGHSNRLALGEVGIVAVGYALGPLIVSRRLTDLPSLGVIGVAMALTALFYAPFALTRLPRHVDAEVGLSVAGLALICTALAFVLFFALIAEVGPSRATVITYFNPAVAILLGVVVLGEPFTAGLALGFPLILLGSVLATGRRAAPA